MSTSTLTRAYSVLHVKAVDAERRQISGLATSPTVDRLGDIIDPFGATFSNPSPLLLHHDTSRPVGEVHFIKATEDGIPFTASFPDPETLRSQTVRERVMEAWDSVKTGLIRGVSIGFRALDGGIEVMKSGGLKFTKTEILELSLVSVPANQDATILTIKSLDAEHLAATGTGAGTSSTTPGASGTCVVKVSTATRKGSMSKPVADQIKDFEATRAAKSARMTEIMAKSADAGATLDATEAEEYDGLEAEVKSLDTHLKRLSDLEKVQKAAAVPVAGKSIETASAARGGERVPVITVRDNLEPGQGFARAVMCQAQAYMEHVNVVELAKARYPDHQALHAYLHVKAGIPGGTTTETTWAAPLVYAQNLAAEFIQFLMPQTIIGKFGTNGVPALTRVPFHVRIPRQTNGGDAWWVGEGAPKPLTSFAFDTVSLTQAKVAAIAVVTKELARFSNPSAEMLVRDALTRAIVERIDTDFIDPAHAVSAGVTPASITNGLSALSSAGTAAANVTTDLTNLLSDFIAAHYDPSSLVLIMPNTLALALSLMRSTLGVRDFPTISVNGGTLEGIPVITSQYAANASGGGNLVIAVSARDIFLADDGNVTVDASDQASLQMLDNPTNNSASATATTMVSMYQTNSIALRAEREITWAKGRSTAVVYMDDVNWGSVGSPA